ncbi:MAG: hypothetical protein J6Q32_00975 [Clostridia bacterium]|nr:hypothetical protein [Clostridia bacterium]
MATFFLISGIVFVSLSIVIAIITLKNRELIGNTVAVITLLSSMFLILVSILFLFGIIFWSVWKTLVITSAIVIISLLKKFAKKKEEK